MALVGVVSVLGIISAGVIATGGAAAVTIATLDQGLPDVREFRDLDFSEPTRITDRTGKVELAEFWNERRTVVDFEDIPPLVLDATTATEDATFWDNPGFDLQATLSAFVTAASGSSGRGGGSTITQQLVRARLLPEDITSADNTQQGLYLRKAKELLEPDKLTKAFPGEDGKKAIITAYLNEMYGAASGIAAAAELYLGKKLDQLTVSEAALLAAIPQSPSTLYPWATDAKGHYTNIVKEAGKKRTQSGKRNTRFVLKTCPNDDATCTDTDLVTRRDYILGRLRDGKGCWTTLSDEQYQEALSDKIVIKKPKASTWQAPHFVNALLPELNKILADRDPIQSGGYKVITTLDMRAQDLGERLIQAGAVLPNLPFRSTTSSSTGSSCAATPAGSAACAAAASATVPWWPWTTAPVTSSPTSARPATTERPRPSSRPRSTTSVGPRQPGSAWKPILYATGIDTERLTAGTYLLDKQEMFGSWLDAEERRRGVPWVHPGPGRDPAVAEHPGHPGAPGCGRYDRPEVRGEGRLLVPGYLRDKALDLAGLAGALGTVEVRPLDMTATFGAFGNGGMVTTPRHILKVLDPMARSSTRPASLSRSRCGSQRRPTSWLTSSMATPIAP